jgi:CubicO group peptidase (beta-lactamase class C family)
MRAADAVDVLGPGDEDAAADDVVEPAAGLGQRAADDLEADAGLLVGVVGRVGVARHDRRRPRDPHLPPHAHGPRVADALLEGRAGGDPLPIHPGSVVAMEALRQVEGWPCAHAAVALVSAAGVQASHGEAGRPFWWASVTKLATAVAVLVAAEEGIVDLDEPAGPPGSTVRHLLAHASGLPFEGHVPLAAPGTRRIYSNGGFELLAEHVAAAAEMPFADYFEHVWGFALAGSPAHGVEAGLTELVAVAHELVAPARIARETLAEAAAVQFPGLGGVLPGFGRYEPNDWGLGLELRDAKRPHWTGERNSQRTFGHFGRGGTFLWVDPEPGLALACLTDLEFGDWAKDAWPRLADAVLAS